MTRIGIVAVSHQRIRSIIDDLGLNSGDVVAIPARSAQYAARGCTLDTLLVDDTAADVDLGAVQPALLPTGGQTYFIGRR